MIVIIDYGMGNLLNVVKAARALSFKVKVTDSCTDIDKADKIILPGVGHFGKAVQELKERKIFQLLKEKIKSGVSFLGICVGMQLLLEQSEEAPGIKGLGIISGEVKKFNNKKVIVPHMGWNQVKVKTQKAKGKTNLFKGITDNSYFYFANSYYCKPKDKAVVLATTRYGVDFASALHKDNIWAVQFHPEKSQAIGLKVFKNFLNI